MKTHGKCRWFDAFWHPRKEDEFGQCQHPTPAGCTYQRHLIQADTETDCPFPPFALTAGKAGSEMSFTLSKNVREGDFVALRGTKIIRASRLSKKLLGVWMRRVRRTVLTIEGQVEEHEIPEGVVMKGEITVRSRG